MDGFELGWIRSWRKSKHSFAFKDAHLWHLWSWCLLEANHKESVWEPAQCGRGNTIVHLNPGQFVFGRKRAARELGMAESSVGRRMNALKAAGQVDIQVSSHFSIVTICNWELYQPYPCDYEQASEQASEQATGRQRAGNGHS